MPERRTQRSTVLDLFPDATVRLDADRCVVDLNGEASALFGQDPEALLGQRVADALGLRFPEGALVLVSGWHPSARLRSVRGVPEHLLVASTASGEIPLRTTGVYERDPLGAVTGAVLAFRRDDRPRHDTAATDLVAAVSHELRWPLTSIKGHTSLLLNRGDRLSPDQKRMMFARIDADTDRITRLVTGLLDISRLDARRLDLDRRPVHLPALVADVLQQVKARYPDLRGRVELPADLPALYVDRDKVAQVLTNLVENAVRHASPDDVQIRAAVDDGVVAVSVIDRGEGVPAAELQALLGRSPGRPGEATGRGIGLWLSRRLVELHGGSLTATSAPGEGSTFRFTLPLRSPDEDTNPDGARQPTPRPARPPRRSMPRPSA